MNLSDKLLRILRSNFDLTEGELNSLTEKKGWEMVYSLQSNKPKENKFEVCFTGFSPSDKKELISIATQKGLHVAKSITKKLDVLCIGDNAGPSKMEKAKQQGSKILTKEEFIHLLDTGELKRN